MLAKFTKRAGKAFAPFFKFSRPVVSVTTSMSEDSRTFLNEIRSLTGNSGPLSGMIDSYEYLCDDSNLCLLDEIGIESVAPREVFANNVVRMDNMDVIGFDYDFTLAHYSSELSSLIYDVAKDYLVRELFYPSAITDITYNPEFGIRGLFFDKEEGLLFKLSSMQKIDQHCVYRGHYQLDPEEIEEIYGPSRFIPFEYKESNLQEMVDLFSLSEICLLADVIQLFNDKDISFVPFSVWQDVRASIEFAHMSGIVHHGISHNLPTFLKRHPDLEKTLQGFKECGMDLFLLTNSTFEFINNGMVYLIGPHWQELFDVVIVEAGKPGFYNHKRPFRLYNKDTKRLEWTDVTELKSGEVYSHGSVGLLMKMQGWLDKSVLYLGDNLFSDWVEPSRKFGWTTGGIIRELEREIRISNQPREKKLSLQAMALEEIMRVIQSPVNSLERSLETRIPFQSDSFDLGPVLSLLHKERRRLQRVVDTEMNPQFGSAFRAEDGPSNFAASLQRYVDLYTSRLENFLCYSPNHRFYPLVKQMAHELQVFQSQASLMLKSDRTESKKQN